MLSNRMEWAAARAAVEGTAFGVTSVFGGTTMPAAAPVAALAARKPRITDAGYAQGSLRAWSPPV